jgi:thiosulfate reductase cytochrome b subunit
VPGLEHLRGLGRTLLDHLRLRVPRGAEAREYNAPQRLAYLGVVLGLLPLAIVTGYWEDRGYEWYAGI